MIATLLLVCGAASACPGSTAPNAMLIAAATSSTPTRSDLVTVTPNTDALAVPPDRPPRYQTPALKASCAESRGCEAVATSRCDLNPGKDPELHLLTDLLKEPFGPEDVGKTEQDSPD